MTGKTKLLTMLCFLLLCCFAQACGSASAPSGEPYNCQPSSVLPEGGSTSAPENSNAPSGGLSPAIPSPEVTQQASGPSQQQSGTTQQDSAAPQQNHGTTQQDSAATQQTPGTTQQASGQSLAPEDDLPKAGVQSLENLIFTALEPVGTTMYVWGGGWNEADTGAGPETLSIGCSERWAEFAAAQDSSYDYRNFRYQIHDGLDCSGYIGWVLYNLFHTEDSQSEEDGYVMKSTLMAKTLADYGWGELIPAADTDQWKPGDICSMSGHVWLSLGTCQDGSVLLLHSSPPGVRICGTLSKDGGKTDAVALAEKWMSTCFPEWYASFPKCGVNDSYLTGSEVMRWNSATLGDAESFQALSAEEIAEHFMAKP